MRNEILRVSHLYKKIGDTLILNDFSMNLYEGEILGIMGLRDSGKSLLFRILTGDEELDKGTLFFNETKVSQYSSLLTNKIALITKKPLLEKNMTVTDNIFHIRRHRHHQFWIREKSYYLQTKEQLNKISININPNSKVEDLTRIECYMVEIIKKYIMGAKVILLDDFSQEFNTNEIAQLYVWLKKLSALGISFILAGYRMDNLQICSERILFLTNGTTGKIITNVKRKQVDENLIFQMPTFKHKKNQIKEKENIVFQAERVSIEEVGEISFKLRQGEIVTLVDFSGINNQRLFECLMNLEKMKKGKLYHLNQIMNGKRLTDRSEDCLFVDFNLKNSVIEQISLQDNLCLGNFHKISTAGFYRQKSMDYIERDFLNWYPNEELRGRSDCRHLSEKDKMAILLYRIRLYKPRVIFCIDPSRYTDALIYGMMQQELHELAKAGISILIMAKTVEQNYQLTDRFLFWEEGKLVENSFDF